MELYNEIKGRVSEPELLAQLAEEAAELSQAALKLRRKLDGRNPTPVAEAALMDNLVEELSDVLACTWVLGIEADTTIANGKLERWRDRLEKADTKRPQLEIRMVPHSRWIKSTKYPGYLVCEHCENCYVLPYWPNGNKWRQCPNCGAIMDLRRE